MNPSADSSGMKNAANGEVRPLRPRKASCGPFLMGRARAIAPEAHYRDDGKRQTTLATDRCNSLRTRTRDQPMTNARYHHLLQNVQQANLIFQTAPNCCAMSSVGKIQRVA